MKPVTVPEPFELTLSFRRDPREHVDAMTAASKRFYGRAEGERAMPYWVAVIAIGALVGLAMELHRRYLLPYLFGETAFPTFVTAIAYFSPLIVLVLVLRFAMILLGVRRQRKRMMRRLGPDEMVDVDVSRSGIKYTMDDSVFFLEWKAIRQIAIIDNRIDLDTASFVVYLPQHAFADRKAFQDGFTKIRSLWRRGVEEALASSEAAK